MNGIRLSWLALAIATLAGCGAVDGDGLGKDRYTIIEVIKAGGNVTVSADKFDRYSLTEIAKAARDANVELTIVDAAKLDRYTMVEIAKAAPRTVHFRD